jgi:hypothetical protein
MCLPLPLCCAVLVCPTVLRAQAAQRVTVFNDVFADSERLTQGLPTSTAWFQNATASAAAAQAGNLAVRNGALTFAVANASRAMWSYFPAVDLKIGESITLTLEFSLTAPITSGMRIGLCHTNGVAPRIGDGPGPTGQYRGYGVENLFLIKRTGSGAADPDAALLNQLSLGDQQVWERVNATARGVQGFPFQAGTLYTFVLEIRRTTSDAVEITNTVIGAGLTGTNTVTLTDSSNIQTAFDTVALAFVGNATSGDLLVTRANIIANIASSTAGRLANMSIRTNAGTGDSTLIVGVGVGGGGTTGAKAALFRAVGPTLAGFGVGGTLADPVITAFQGSAQFAQNDDWTGGFDFNGVGAFAFATNTPRDAALYHVAVPIGSYSLQITGKNNGTGIALAEIYDATPASLFTATTPRLVNVSARTEAGTGENVLIAGFAIAGSTPVRVLIRAAGPALAALGVTGTLSDPRLDVFDSANLRVAESDNWGGTSELKTAFSSVAAFAFPADNSRDAALVATLPPGTYTAQISGVGGTIGVAIVELYELP